MPIRMPLPTDAELSADVREVLGSLPPLNIFRAIANAPASLKPFVDYGMSILFHSELDPRLREIAVLRVAHVTGSRYEWHQHVTVAHRAGVTDEEIAKIAVEGPVTELGEDANFLCRVADEISRDVRLSDEALAKLLERYGRRRAMELILCCAHFNMVSRILESARIEIEGENVLERWPLPGR